MRVEESEELPRVMHEIREAMGARTTLLTQHPDGSDQPSEVYADRGTLSPSVVKVMLEDAESWMLPPTAEQHRWVRHRIDGIVHDVLNMPVQRVPGHSRLVISALFEPLSEAARDRAEAVYLARRPFAVGYFRLWQIDRTRKRRIIALETALDRSDLGVMLLDRSGKLAFANAAGRTLLANRDGLRRHDHGIAATELSDGVRLQVAINHVIGQQAVGTREQPATLLRLARKAGPALVVSILPSEQPVEEESDVAALLYVVDPAVEIEQLLQPICKLYRLTPVETKLVSLLTNGATIAEGAIAMRTKEQTARGVLKQIFVKTNTSRQGELIRLMFTNLVRASSTSVTEVI